MVVDHDVYILTKRLAQAGDVISEPGDNFSLVDVLICIPGVSLDSRETVLDVCASPLDVTGSAVGPDLISYGASQQLVYRNTQRFSLDVPEGLVDGAERRIDDHPPR